MHYSYEFGKVKQTFRDPLPSDYVLKSAENITIFGRERLNVLHFF